MAKATKPSAKNIQESLAVETETPVVETPVVDGSPTIESEKQDSPTVAENTTVETTVESVSQETPVVEDTATTETSNEYETQATPESDVPDEDEELIARYKKLYPQNKVFHLTSDKQVFLDTGKRDAENHQKTLGEGSLKSYHQHSI